MRLVKRRNESCIRWRRTDCKWCPFGVIEFKFRFELSATIIEINFNLAFNFDFSWNESSRREERSLVLKLFVRETFERKTPNSIILSYFLILRTKLYYQRRANACVYILAQVYYSSKYFSRIRSLNGDFHGCRKCQFDETNEINCQSLCKKGSRKTRATSWQQPFRQRKHQKYLAK